MHYLFIVDTDSYAGNFEREMTAYMTGIVGDCEVGNLQADIFESEEEYDFEQLVIILPDDNGCHRPCSVWESSSGDYGNAFAIYMQEEPSEEDFEVLKRRAFAYKRHHGPNKILGFSLEKVVTTHTEIKKWEV